MRGRGALTNMRRRAAAVTVVTLVAIVAPARADAPAVGLVASTEHVGRVDLAFFGPPGAAVRFGESWAGRNVELGRATTDVNGFAPLLTAATWRCDRQSRRFTATTTSPQGGAQAATFEVHTPSCAGRLEIGVPRHVVRGARVPVRIVDGWHLGDDTVPLCVSGAGVSRRCSTIRLVRGRAGVLRRVTAPRSGMLRVAVDLHGYRVAERVAVGTATPPDVTAKPVLLATGDSTIEGVDSYLAERLGSTVRTAFGSRPGTGLSLDGELPWPQAAGEQVRRLAPRVTVISLGANDTYPMRTADGQTVACCSAAWGAQYAARAGSLMRTYTAGGGRLLWLLLPVPRASWQAAAFAAINDAVRDAAAGVRDVRLLDVGDEISPGGVYTDTLMPGGATVPVRAQDGVHLSAAGASIVADAVLRDLRQTGWLTRPAR
jgi:lysophospholipase L1-like esterase